MGDEQLIDLVRKHDVIYNIKCIEYRDATLRNAAWEEVAKLHGKPVEECKENWNKLRNCYNNAMKRRQKKSGNIMAPWRFEEQMTFLKPYMDSRHTTGNLATVSNEYSSLPSPESTAYAESSTSPEICPSRPRSSTSNASYKRRASSSSDDYLADMIEIMRNSTEVRQKRQELDDLDTFFLSMSKSVRQLPKRVQIRIKMNLLKAVSEAELKQLESNK